MSTEPLVFNGIDGASGGYLLPPLTVEQISKIAQKEEFDPEYMRELSEKINPPLKMDVIADIDKKILLKPVGG